MSSIPDSNKQPDDPTLPFNQIDENKIIKRPVAVLNTVDEFTNDKTEYLVKMFHSKLKALLNDPTKLFYLLTNDDMNNDTFTCHWSNDPQMEGKKFDLRIQRSEDNRPMNETPMTVPLKNANSNSYITDEFGKHFPTEILKFTNANYWYSDIKEEKLLHIEFQKQSKVKYIGINFFNPTELRMLFDVAYNTMQRDVDGFIIKTIAKDLTNLPTDDIQIIEFKEPILTNEIFLKFKSEKVGVNYVVVISNELSEEALSMFTHIQKQ